ncbi:MAG: hypothetical protein ACXAC6_08980, partial [Candidatus Hodarchaeales archaeon]
LYYSSSTTELLRLTFKSIQEYYMVNNMREVTKVRLKVNDTSIGVKKFVQEFIGKAIFGMISSLRIKDLDIQKITLEIEYEEKKK